MVDLDYWSYRTGFHASRPIRSRIAAIFERILFAWIWAAAALTFLVAIILAVFDIITLWQLLYIYLAINVVTLLIALVVYLAKRDS